MVNENPPADQDNYSLASRLMFKHWPEMRINFREAGLWSSKHWRDKRGIEHKEREALEHELLEAGICHVLAEKIDLPENEKELLETAALLHDLHKSPKFRKEAHGIKEWLVRKGYDEETTEQIENVVIRGRLSKKGYDPRILKLIEVTDPEVMKRYAHGEFWREEDLLSRILFFADEINGKDEEGKPAIVDYEERINS